MQILPGGPGSARGHAAGKNHRIHGAGAGGADRLDCQPAILKQPVEHTPDKGAMRASALQSEVDLFRNGIDLHLVSDSSASATSLFAPRSFTQRRLVWNSRRPKSPLY